MNAHHNRRLSILAEGHQESKKDKDKSSREPPAVGFTMFQSWLLLIIDEHNKWDPSRWSNYQFYIDSGHEHMAPSKEK